MEPSSSELEVGLHTLWRFDAGVPAGRFGRVTVVLELPVCHGSFLGMMSNSETRKSFGY